MSKKVAEVPKKAVKARSISGVFTSGVFNGQQYKFITGNRSMSMGNMGMIVPLSSIKISPLDNERVLIESDKLRGMHTISLSKKNYATMYEAIARSTPQVHLVFKTENRNG